MVRKHKQGLNEVFFVSHNKTYKDYATVITSAKIVLVY